MPGGLVFLACARTRHAVSDTAGSTRHSTARPGGRP